MLTPSKLATELRNSGIEVLRHHNKSSSTDAGVDLPNGVDVQISGGCYTLNQWVEDDEAIWELGSHKSVKSLIKSIKNLNK